MKILVDENMPYARELFSRLGEVQAVPGRPIPQAELNDADALMVRSVTQVNRDLLAGKTSGLSVPPRRAPITLMKITYARRASGFPARPAATLSRSLNMCSPRC